MMATSRTFLQNASTRHAIFINRFSGSQVKEFEKALDRIQAQINSELRKGNVSNFGKRRLTALYARLDKIMADTYEQTNRKFTNEMKQFGVYEADFSARMFEKGTQASFAIPSNTQVEAAVFGTPLSLKIGKEQLTVEAALVAYSKQKRKEMIRTIQDGVIAGATNDQISKRVAFVATKIQKNHATALVRTVTNHTATLARIATLEENEDIIEGYEWVSTLDGKTTHTCQSLDGQIFPVNSGPRPPIHWGCRSTTIPVVKDEFSIKNKVKIERPAKGSAGTEQVSSRKKYPTWIKEQSNEFQDEVLGPVRAKLLREGGLEIKQFTDKNFAPLNLDQLRRKEPLAFEKAGL